MALISDCFFRLLFLRFFVNGHFCHFIGLQFMLCLLVVNFVSGSLISRLKSLEIKTFIFITLVRVFLQKNVALLNLEKYLHIIIRESVNTKNVITNIPNLKNVKKHHIVQ